MLRVIAAILLVTLCHQGQAASADKAKQKAQVPTSVRTSAVKYDFNYAVTAGIERRRVYKGFEVRGWKVGSNVYIGQAKVGDRWGAGLIVDKGAVKYGINNRGLQFIRRF